MSEYLIKDSRHFKNVCYLKILIPLFLLCINSNLLSQSPETIVPKQILENAILQLESANYDSSQILTEKALKLFEVSSVEQQEYVADCYNNFGRISMRKDQFQAAINWHEKALRIRLNIFGKDHFQIASSFNNLGNSYLQLSNFEAAIAYHKKALQIRQNYKDEKPLDLAKSYNNLASTFYRMQDLGNAFRYFSVALQIREQILEADDVQLASIKMNIGNCFLANASYEESLEYFEAASKIFQSNYEGGHPDVADVFFNIGNALFGKKNYSNAIQNYENALLIQKEINGKSSLKVADIYQNIGHAFGKKGDYVLALQYFENAKSIRDKLLPTNHPDLGDSFEAIGLSFLEDGNPKKALKEQQKVLQIRKLFFEEKSNKIGGTYSNLGNVFYELELPDSAIFYYKKAEKSLAQNPISLAKNYNNLGSCFAKKAQSDASVLIDDWEHAFDYFDRAINTASDYGINNANYWKNAGIALAKLGKYEEADLRFQAALNILEYEEKQPFPNTDALPDLIGILQARATLYYQKYKKKNREDWLQKSILEYELAINLMNELRLTYTESGSQQKLLENSFRIFEGLIECYFEQIRRTGHSDWIEKAFAVSEKSKSLILLEALRKSNAEKFGDIPDSLLLKEEELKTDIAFLGQKKKEAQQYEDAESLQLFTQKIFEAKQNQKSLIDQFEKEFPKYFQLKYESEILSLSEIQESLFTDNDNGRGQGIMEYFIGEKSIYIFLISKKELRAFEVKKDFPLDEWVASIRKSIYFYPNLGARASKRLNEEYLEIAHQLFEKIIPKYDLPDRLIIIPDGVLNYLPFEALLTEIPEKKARFKTHDYFLKKHQISYAYSTLLLKEMQKELEEKDREMLATFAPNFEGSKYGLSILKHNKEEAIAVSDIFDGVSFYDESANLEQFLELAQNYRILHLATHGKANIESGEYSFLAFSETDDSLSNLLYIKDLYGRKLNSEMVVLSACETGIGEFKYGEGVVSLAQGFSYAGAKSIVTSLWSVNDAATADLMKFFYKNLKIGMTKEVALHHAKLEFLESRPHDEAHPFFWAGFIPIGDMSAIGSRDFSNWILGLFVLGVLFVVLLYRNRRNKN